MVIGPVEDVGVVGATSLGGAGGSGGGGGGSLGCKISFGVAKRMRESLRISSAAIGRSPAS
jgi:hypothetical protein